jgi:hypothetical protein
MSFTNFVTLAECFTAIFSCIADNTEDDGPVVSASRSFMVSLEPNNDSQLRPSSTVHMFALPILTLYRIDL